MTGSSKASSVKYSITNAIKPTIAPLSAMISSALAAGSLQAATITVDSLGSGFEAGNCTLRSALYASTRNAVADGCVAGDAGSDTIVFQAGLQGTIDLLPGSGTYFDGSTLPIGESVEIDGGGVITVDGSGAAPVFYAKYGGLYNAEEVIISDLTITGGGGERGAGILSQVPNLSVRNSVVTGNTASDAGGGIWHSTTSTGSRSFFISYSEISQNGVTGANSLGGGVYSKEYLQVFNSTISDNESAGSGGGVAQYNGRSLRFFETNVTGNDALGGNGGGVALFTDTNSIGRFTTFESVFSGNYATGNGGAISLIDTNTNLYTGGTRIYGTRFESNVAAGQGGALYVSRADRQGNPDDPVNQINIVDSGADGLRTLFLANTAGGDGGGAALNLGDNNRARLQGATFVSNRAFDGEGGGAEVRNGSGGTLLSDVVFTSNQALGNFARGGGLNAVISGEGSLSVIGMTGYSNYATGAGGGARMAVYGGEIGVSDSYFGSNYSGQSYGGGMSVYGSPVEVDFDRLILTGNGSALSGGGLDLFSTGTTTVSSIDNSEITGNTSDGRGGGLYLSVDTASNFFLRNSTLSGNDGATGGAVFAAGAMNFELKYSTVANNEASVEAGGVAANLAEPCTVARSLLDLNVAGAGNATQDIRNVGPATADCAVNDSLLAGNDSEFTNVSGNILGQASLIEALADNGGNGGRTHALPQNSPAIDAAGTSGTFTPDTDQRGPGFPREFGAGLDMGAFEFSVIIDEMFSDRFESP